MSTYKGCETWIRSHTLFVLGTMCKALLLYCLSVAMALGHKESHAKRPASSFTSSIDHLQPSCLLFSSQSGLPLRVLVSSAITIYRICLGWISILRHPWVLVACGVSRVWRLRACGHVSVGLGGIAISDKRGPGATSRYSKR